MVFNLLLSIGAERKMFREKNEEEKKMKEYFVLQKDEYLLDLYTIRVL